MALMAVLAWGVDSAAPAKKAKKRPVPSASTTKKSGASARRGTKAPTPRVTWRNRQMAPSKERYREIQTALAARGYLPPEEANGTWNQTSMDALKKFQAEQNLESTGKINSLSLIALGLGPKHDAPAAPAKAPPEVPQPPAGSQLQ